MPGPIAIISLNTRGTEVKKLHSALAKLGLTIPKHELDAEQFGVGTRDVLLAFQKQHGLKATGALDEATQAALDKAVAETADGKHRVEGRILFENGVPAGGLAL